MYDPFEINMLNFPFGAVGDWGGGGGGNSFVSTYIDMCLHVRQKALKVHKN